ncbi:hypothetical protein C8R44DRAFT_798419 [Mycena epipterygia]|nr:hypothetical protein C8R44DRAFT_798419 [Mycena epipterygia]
MLLIYAFPVAPSSSAPPVLAWAVSVFLLIHPSIFAVRVIHLVPLLSLSCRCSLCTVPPSSPAPSLILPFFNLHRHCTCFVCAPVWNNACSRVSSCRRSCILIPSSQSVEKVLCLTA